VDGIAEKYAPTEKARNKTKKKKNPQADCALRNFVRFFLSSEGVFLTWKFLWYDAGSSTNSCGGECGRWREISSVDYAGKK
jgi:hypothetical protein